MKLLISPRSHDEVEVLASLGVDIVDLKNPAEGALGAPMPWDVTAAVRRLEACAVEVSVSLGDLRYQPGTAALAACGALACGARYLKAGLYGVTAAAEAREILRAVRRAAPPPARIVAAGYADHARFGGLAPSGVLEAASAASAEIVLLDTAVKDGATLFDALSPDALARFAAAARGRGLQVALAGSLSLAHIETVAAIGADFAGVRGAACEAGDRLRPISRDRARALIERARAAVREKDAGRSAASERTR